MPMLPFADELRRRDHEVVWVSAADACHRLAERGFDVRAHGLSVAERLPRAAATLAERAAGVPPNEMRAHAFTTHFAVLAAPAAWPGMRSVVESFRPDVIVREPGELASPLAARSAGVPVVTVGFGGIVPAAARRMADEALASLHDSAGIDAGDDVHLGDLYLHPMPASMDQGPLPASVRRVRPPSSSQTFEANDVDDLGRSRPAVYATFGTEFGPSAPWVQLVAALAELDVDALLTTGAAGLPAGLRMPPNVRAVEYVDQHEILGRVSVVVSHAGSGTLLGAAQHAVPQVCIPIGADQFENSAAASARGIGVSIAPGDRDRGAIRDAIVRALTDRSMADAARAVSEEIATAAGPDEAADWIEGLTDVTFPSM